MNTQVARVAVIAAFITVGSWLIGVPHALADHDDDKFVYTINVLCQFSGGTNINIHNPNERTVRLTERGVPLEFGQVTTALNAPQRASLRPDHAVLMGCDDFAALGGVGSSGSGDVIIESDRELVVWAVYLSIVAGGGIGETRGPLRIPATKVKR